MLTLAPEASHPSARSMTWPSRRQAVAWLLAPALLLGVAGMHTYLVETKRQTPWEGGGFGMFSTMDKRQARFVRCVLVTPEQAVPVRTPAHLDTYVERMRARPTTVRARRLAQFLADAEWVRSDPARVDTAIGASDRPAGLYRYRPPSEMTNRPTVVVESVRVEIWRYRFRTRSYQLRARPLVRVTASRSDAS